jgi:hypothetical protein
MDEESEVINQKIGDVFKSSIKEKWFLGNETITKSRLSVTMCENAHRYFVLSVCV